MHRPSRGLVSLVAGIGLLVVSGCTGQAEAPQPTDGSGKAGRTRNVARLSSAPASPRLMQVYFDKTNGREWIFDGVGWVPHDRTVEDFQAAPGGTPPGAKPGARPMAALSVPFSPSGAHAKHAAYECVTCHTVGGSPCFDPAGPAVGAGVAAPAFDSSAKTCSSVACHGANSGIYTYARWDWGLEDYEWINVAYSGSGGGAASWYSPAGTSTCASCHGNPPANTGNWHAPSHGASLAAAKKCETCHPDAVSAVVGGATVGVAINPTNAAMHGNGMVNVQAKFSSKCFGCH